MIREAVVTCTQAFQVPILKGLLSIPKGVEIVVRPDGVAVTLPGKGVMVLPKENITIKFQDEMAAGD